MGPMPPTGSSPRARPESSWSRPADGPSFEIDGWEVRWQRWRFRVGFTAREGLVLHAVGYEDGRPGYGRSSGVPRWQSSYIPYADPRPFLGYRNAFDIGEYGIGIMANSLEYGCDCLGEIRYFDESSRPTPAESRT